MVALAAAVGAGGGRSDGGGVRRDDPVRANPAAADAPANAWHAGASTELHPTADPYSTADLHHDTDTGDVYADASRTANDHARDSNSRLGCL